MNTPKPATVVAALTVTCTALDSAPTTHRIWINRDGTVLTPDHVSSEEDALEALGGHLTHPCAHWHAAVLCKKNNKVLSVPTLRTWEFESGSAWTQNAMWTALTAILGSATFTPLAPDLALEHAKVYQAYGDFPADLVSHLGYLQSPWLRTGGFRRTRPTTPAELVDLLDAGIPVNRVASAAALDLDGATAKHMVTRLNVLNIPADVALNLAYALPPVRLVTFVDRLDRNNADALTINLSRLKEQAAGLDDAQTERFLLGLAPA